MDAEELSSFTEDPLICRTGECELVRFTAAGVPAVGVRKVSVLSELSSVMKRELPLCDKRTGSTGGSFWPVTDCLQSGHMELWSVSHGSMH